MRTLERLRAVGSVAAHLPGGHSRRRAEKSSGGRFEEAPEFGGEVFVVEGGAHSAPPLLLLHGLGPGHADFAPILPALRAHYHVLSVDLPGFGRSSRGQPPYTPVRYADFAAALIARHFAQPAAVLGHSLGAGVAIELASRHPERVSKLALLDVAGMLHHHEYTRFLIGGWFPRRPRYARARAFVTGPLFEFVTGELARLGFGPSELARAHPWLGSRQLAALALAHHDFGPALRAVRAPTWLGWGKHDTVAPLRTADALRYLLRPVHFELFTGSGHVPMRSEPDQLVRSLRAFLDREHGVRPVEPVSGRSARSARHAGPVRCYLEGDFDSLELYDGADVVLHDARVRVLHVERSRVELVRTSLGGSGAKLTLRGAQVVWTGGRADPEVCVHIEETALDLMGVDLACSLASRAAPSCTLVASITQQHTNGRTTSLHFGKRRRDAAIVASGSR